MSQKRSIIGSVRYLSFLILPSPVELALKKNIEKQLKTFFFKHKYECNMKFPDKIKSICCIGAGYVGGPTMAVIADKCPEISITVVDMNAEKIALWNSNDLNLLPVYEPGLDSVIARARGRNLFFSTDIDKAIRESDMIFISVSTPTKTFGKGKGMAADLKYIEASARKIAEVSDSDKIVVEKSTIPIRTAQAVRNILSNSDNGAKFQVLSNPEFLAEGTAVNDLLFPDRVLIGGEQSEDGSKALELLANIYRTWIPDDRIIKTNIWSSELSKLVANAFLAQRISSINSISALCEKTGADVEEVARAIGADSRVGPKFLKPSVGFGGSCFQKDILNLVYICRTYGLEEVADYWENVLRINDYQKYRFADSIIEKLNNTLSGKKIAFLGWAFKKDTNDSRESAAIYIADRLIEDRGEIYVYDPKVSKQRMTDDLNELSTRTAEENNRYLHFCNNPYEALEGAFAVAILTEWDEFKTYDWEKVFAKMQKPAFIFDGRNLLDHEMLRKTGFQVQAIGK
jgi:UDPglucose 6-dehydrogenase